MIEEWDRYLSKTVFMDRSLCVVRWKEKREDMTLCLDKGELTFKSTGILEINPLSVDSFANIFSHSEGCLFVLFMVSFAVQKL